MLALLKYLKVYTNLMVTYVRPCVNLSHQSLPSFAPAFLWLLFSCLHIFQ